MIKSDVELGFCPCIRNNHNHTLVLVLHRNWTSLLFRPSIALHTVVSVHTYYYIRYTLIRSFIFHICQGSYRMNVLLYIEPILNYTVRTNSKAPLGMLREYPYNSYQSLLYSKCNCKTLESIRGKMINPCQYYLTV